MQIYSILFLSFKISIVAVAIQTVPAIFCGWYLSRQNKKFSFFYNALLLLPITVTPIVIGYFILQVFKPNGWLGSFLQLAGIEIIFNWKGAVIVVSIISFPLYVQSIQIAISAIPKKLETLSLLLGKTSWQTFLKVSLPLARFGIIKGALLAFSRSMGEFGATVVVAGIIPTQTETIPAAIFRALNSPNQEQRVQLLVVTSILVSLFFIFLIQWIEYLNKKN